MAEREGWAGRPSKPLVIGKGTIQNEGQWLDGRTSESRGGERTASREVELGCESRGSEAHAGPKHVPREANGGNGGEDIARGTFFEKSNEPLCPIRNGFSRSAVQTH